MIRKLGVLIGIAALSMVPVLHAHADTPSSPEIFMREVKITGDEFIVLQASEDIALSDYWLGYSSSDAATNIVPTQQLPAYNLKAGQAILLTSDGANTCDAVLVNKLSFSLSDTKGTLVIRKLESSGATSTFTTIDSVNWSKPSASGTTTDVIDLRKETATLALPVWYHGAEVASWQVGDLTSCTFSYTSAKGAPVTSVIWPANDIEPPAVIESLADDDGVSAGPYLPAADIGLMPPQITEVLPNPMGTGTDGTDEFIELYNPNGTVFDLSGFVLQTGLTTKHSYTFPMGTTLPPKSFVAFYSADTGLSLSNTSGQADLEDPFKTVVAQTDAYDTAKDGMAWALAKGDWYWTNKPTPSAANVINQSAVSTSSIKGNSSKSVSAIKGTSAAVSPLAAATPSASSDATKSSGLHPYILAGIAPLAVGYGVYEYRHDLGNRIHQFRANRAARRVPRK